MDTPNNETFLNEPEPIEEKKRATDFCLSTSLEFLLNKKVYKKITGGGKSLQTIRENEERKIFMKKYGRQLVELFTKLLNDGENVTISQEIHGIFETFVDKAVRYFIRKDEMENDRDDDEDAAIFMESSHHGNEMSNWGDDIVLDDS
jgi:polyribonucleotide nucleotidyltransferase